MPSSRWWPFTGRRRRTLVFGVGAAKTGTTTLASMLGQLVRSAHEPEPEALAELIIARADGALDDAAVASVLRERVRRLKLEADVSQLNGMVVEDLVRAFPDARFVLTIRDCRSWLTSFLADSLRRDPPLWRRMKEFRFATSTPHVAEEAALDARGLYTLDGYLGYWARHNQRVLDAVPPERLLVLRTDRLDQSLDELAGFLGLSVSNATSEPVRLNQAPRREGLLDEIDSAHVGRVEARHAAPLMARYFPDLPLGSPNVPN